MPDLLPRTDPNFGPALSATTDKPQFAAASAPTPSAPAASSPSAASAPSASASPPASAPSVSAAAEGPTPEGTQPPAGTAPPAAKKDGVSQRISEVTQARKAAETRADKAEALLAQTLEVLKTLTPKEKAEAKEEAAADPRPKRESFTDPDKYDDALIEWTTRGAARVAGAQAKAEIAAAAAEKADSDAREAKAAADTRMQKDFTSRCDEFKKTHEDFSEVLDNEDVPLSWSMTQAILHSDDGPAMAYFLAKNQKEAERIAALSPERAMVEMGRLSAKLSAAPPPPKLSDAPPPIKPLAGGGKSGGSESAGEPSMADYAAKREAELRKRA